MYVGYQQINCKKHNKAYNLTFVFSIYWFHCVISSCIYYEKRQRVKLSKEESEVFDVGRLPIVYSVPIVWKCFCWLSLVDRRAGNVTAVRVSCEEGLISA